MRELREVNREIFGTLGCARLLTVHTLHCYLLDGFKAFIIDEKCPSNSLHDTIVFYVFFVMYTKLALIPIAFAKEATE